jgi:hypothetical protein
MKPADFIHLMMRNDYCSVTWTSSSSVRMYDLESSSIDLGYPGHRPQNRLQSMTSNFEPFSILFDDRAPSLSSVALLICTSHLLLPPHDLQSSVCFCSHCASR